MVEPPHYRQRGERLSQGFTKLMIQLALVKYPGAESGAVRAWVQQQMGPLDSKTFNTHLKDLLARGRVVEKEGLLRVADGPGLLRDVLDYVTGNRNRSELEVFLGVLGAAKEGLVRHLKEPPDSR